MRILLISRSLPMHRLGGMEVIAWELAKSFQTAGHSVTIMTTLPPPTLQVLPGEADGVHLVYVDSPSGVYSLRWWVGSRALFNDLQEDFDVVLSVSAAGLSLPLSRGTGPLSFAQLHGTAVTEVKSKLKERGLLRRARAIKNLFCIFLDLRYRIFDGLIAVGPAVLEDISRNPSRLILGNSSRYLISNGIKEADFLPDRQARLRIRSQLGIPVDAKVGICASRLHEQKGVAESLAGFERARHSEGSLYLIIAGDGPERLALEQQSNALGLREWVRFVGNVGRDQIADYYRASDYLLFTTKRVEGLAMSVLEALASGLHVIVSRHIYRSEFRGAGVDPGNREEIAAAILSIRPEPIRGSLLPSGYSMDSCVSAYLALFSDLLARRAQPASKHG